MYSFRKWSLIKNIALILIVIGVFFTIGALIALMPSLISRLAPAVMIFLIVLLAFLSKSNTEISEYAIKSWVLILLSTMALWPTYFVVKFGGLPSIDARRIVIGLTLAITVFLVISKQKLIRDVLDFSDNSFKFICFSLIALIFWRVLSCIGSPQPFTSFIQVFWDIFYYYSMFIVGILFLSQENIQHWIMKVFMWLAILIFAFAIVEWFLQENLLLRIIPVSDQFLDLKTMLGLSRLRDGFYRVQGTFEHPLLLAEFSVMTASLALANILFKNQRYSLHILAIITLILSILVAILTGSRSALLTLLVAGGFIIMIWVFSPKKENNASSGSVRKVSFIMTFFTLFFLVLPVLTFLIQGRSKGEAASTLGRVDMLELGLASIQNNPFIGTGPGTAGLVAGIKTGNGLMTLDNYLLGVAIESGIPALILLLVCLLYPIWIVFNKVLSNKYDNSSFYVTSASFLIITILFHTILWMPYNMFFVFLFAGSTMASLSKYKFFKLNSSSY